MKKIFTIAFALILIFALSSVAFAQITKGQYYARSTLSGNELEFYDYFYKQASKGDTHWYEDFGLSEKRAREIADYVWGDAPELFNDDGLYSSKKIQEINGKIETITKDVLNLINEGMTDYEKVKTIYYWIGENVSYDSEAEELILHGELDSVQVSESQTIVGGLVNKNAVCAGIARSLQYILHSAGVECYLINGAYNGAPHGWLLIKIDGEWYQADPTVDNVKIKVNELEYFLFNDEFMKRGHMVYDDQNPPLPACTSDKYMQPEPPPTPTPTPTPQPTAEPVVASIQPETIEEAPIVTEKTEINPVWCIILGAAIAAAVIIPLVRRKRKV